MKLKFNKVSETHLVNVEKLFVVCGDIDKNFKVFYETHTFFICHNFFFLIDKDNKTNDRNNKIRYLSTSLIFRIYSTKK